MVSKCQIATVVTGQCPGHGPGKFDDCLAEALYEEWSDSSDDTTGDSEFEGSMAFFNFARDETVQLTGRKVIVPAGYYLLHEQTNGSVILITAHTLDEAWNEFTAFRNRWERWDKGCDQEGHEECEAEDYCLQAD